MNNDKHDEGDAIGNDAVDCDSLDYDDNDVDESDNDSDIGNDSDSNRGNDLVVICTDLCGKEPHIQVGGDRMIT